MGSAASVDLKTASEDDLKKMAAEMSAEDKVKYASMLSSEGASEAVAANVSKIRENKGKLYEIEQKVMEN
eukprot:CAMPEP_0197645824 /NCGR_PEP_ID=MMETSP1338-20131121/20791_1 /TAXON_ID=43686 ORGANISM="Pelagodinium beii, Strain RCC1491" /NCGR_SAMPLE_ID=MMETSP1338 /ASSEMBLY_ACC=CAM_ASM_000754 /LENGTH=69 /DNA_ID=CAMNT_0043219381 /DNA_START=61 /DNA_END=267 /DNA_ORIENTATION=+